MSSYNFRGSGVGGGYDEIGFQSRRPSGLGPTETGPTPTSKLPSPTPDLLPGGESRNLCSTRVDESHLGPDDGCPDHDGPVGLGGGPSGSREDY